MRTAIHIKLEKDKYLQGKRSPETVHTHLDWDHGSSKSNGEREGMEIRPFRPASAQPADQKHYINVSGFCNEFPAFPCVPLCPLWCKKLDAEDKRNAGE